MRDWDQEIIEIRKEKKRKKDDFSSLNSRVCGECLGEIDAAGWVYVKTWRWRWFRFLCWLNLR